MQLRTLMASRTSCGGSGMVLAEHSMGSSSAQTPSAWPPTRYRFHRYSVLWPSCCWKPN